MIPIIIGATLLVTGCSTAIAGKAQPDPAADFVPSAADRDPSKRIPGVVTEKAEGVHVLPGQRVAYDHLPPFGGKHDPVWAACNGAVYAKAVRTEHMVHALEHGAVWIAYNPDQVSGGALDQLKARVDGKPYMLLSPYPGLDKPVSLQSWEHQLKVDTVDDPRIGQFIVALRTNPNTYFEVGAPCDSPQFDIDNPPPFDPAPPGADAVPPK
ncbi:DUF3105 domain-containing protein [Amycolatopsis xylanica]|uniref:DUF3105 domain-containing protein n=1 Tax=Amycolatopsis xylanica TaxID=589385 RepID=UPI001FE17E96|nr:DUF3105 domain-containing protein [Amycolatopsis xylanica]